MNKSPWYSARELIRVVGDDAGDAGRAVRVLHDLRAKAEAVVRLAEARVIRAAKEHVRGLRVAIGREQVAERIEGQAERIHLPAGEKLDVRAIGAEAVDVAAFELDFLAVGSLHGAAVDVAVTGVDPAIDGIRERVVEAVGIALAKRAEDDFAFFGEAVAVGVGETVLVGNAEADCLVCADRRDADRDVQVVGEGSDLGGGAVGIEAVNDAERIAALGACGFRVRILDGAGEPQASGGIEIEVHRLVDVGLGGDELDLEAGRQVKLFQLLLRREGRVVDDGRVIRGRGDLNEKERENCDRDRDGACQRAQTANGSGGIHCRMREIKGA